ncbi:MAG: formylglycine-generating enzyme family protein [Rhodothermales bacterium]
MIKEKIKYGLLIILVGVLTGFVLLHESDLKRDYSEQVRGASFVMKEIPGGVFMMGCGLEDEPCANEEGIDKSGGKSLRQVVIEPFYLAESEMTWEVYERCIDAGVCRPNDEDGGDNGLGKADLPVIEVSWNEVTQDFIPWLNQETGRSYRLPTEAEWEYAARAGTTTRYSWGNEITCAHARYGYHVDQCGKQFGSLPVKSFSPNAFGLFDMHGNVWEFVQDCWSNGLTNNALEGLEPGECKEIVLRGGSWLNEPLFLGSASRYRHDRTYRESGDGFRLAHDLN